MSLREESEKFSLSVNDKLHLKVSKSTLDSLKSIFKVLEG